MKKNNDDDDEKTMLKIKIIKKYTYKKKKLESI